MEFRGHVAHHGDVLLSKLLHREFRGIINVMYGLEDVLLLAVCMSMPLATWLVTKAMEASLITTLSLDSALNVSTTPSCTQDTGEGHGTGHMLLGVCRRMHTHIRAHRHICRVIRDST